MISRHLMLLLFLVASIAALSSGAAIKKKCYLSNCKVCKDLATCAQCEQGFRKRFVLYGRRTICALSCGSTLEDFTDNEGQLACRKRTDLAGCKTDWCMRCRPGYTRVSKGPFKYYCIDACPPNFSPVYRAELDTSVCEKDSTTEDEDQGDENGDGYDDED